MALCLAHLVSLGLAVRVVPRVELRDVDDDVDVVRAHLVAGHVDWTRVGGDVYLAEDVEKVRLFKPAVISENVDQVLQRGQLRNQLLDHLAKGLEDGVVINGREIVMHGSILIAGIAKLVRDTLDDVLEHVGAVLVREPIDLVDEDLDVDVRVVLLDGQDGTVQTRHGVEVVILGIDNPDQSTESAKDILQIEGRLEVLKLAGEVPNLEVHEGAEIIS